ncbi:MAG: aquaporin [Elusimicrobia bacterium]|nr:aquaporin [Elusimicrobiota bacterium]
MGGLRSVASELAGTFALTLAGAGAACLGLGSLGYALAYAAGTAAAYYAFPGPASRFNPALTLADLALKRAGVLRSVLALAAQLLGAACAGLFLRAVLEGGRPDLLVGAGALGACAPLGIGYRAATLIEAVLTFFLACAAAASQTPRRRATGPLLLGAATLFGALVGGPLTGGAMNPARAFGPAVAAGRWSRHYVYWVGPLAGAVLAALLAPTLVSEENRP